MARMLLHSAAMHPLTDGQATGNEPAGVGRPLAARYEAGTLLCGKYRLEALLGEGGMGAVWRACNVLLDLPVAIKLIRADLDRGALRARLQLEARSAAKLGHPSIVRVFDIGESELGDPFIVMEHLRGETLAHLLGRGRVAATRAVQLLLPIIDALAMAHAHGIVHRDLKPDNLMLAAEEHHVCPKILDFGIAKLTAPGDSAHKLTEFGAVIGSPEYMSPEQARGRDDIDASTDIWSICVVLYEAVTGSPPFGASNCNALLRSIVEDAPKPLSECGLDEPALWQLLERGLHKDRAQRFGDIAQLGRALAAWLVARGVTEDARGTALDCQWLTRESHRSIADGTAPHGGPSDELGSQSPQRSVPENTGLVRGPFTNTIVPRTPVRARSRRSVRMLAAAACAASLLMLSLLAVRRSPRASTSPPVSTLAKGPALAAASGAPPNTLVTVAEPAPMPPLTRPERLDDSVPQAERSTTPEPGLKPIFRALRAQPTATNRIRANSVTGTQTVPDRAVDLLPAY